MGNFVLVCPFASLGVWYRFASGPTVRHHADDFTAMLAPVAVGQGVGMVPQLALYMRMACDW